jgi:hypothetical protein
VKLLLEGGANPNATRFSQYPPLYDAVMHAPFNIEIVKLILEHGADPNLQPNYPYNNATLPLAIAMRQGNQELIALLKQHGARALNPRTDDSESQMKKSVEAQRQIHSVATYRDQLTYADLLQKNGKPDEAEINVLEALSALHSTYGAHADAIGDALLVYARIQRDKGDFTGAEDSARLALANFSPPTINSAATDTKIQNARDLIKQAVSSRSTNGVASGAAAVSAPVISKLAFDTWAITGRTFASFNDLAGYGSSGGFIVIECLGNSQWPAKVVSTRDEPDMITARKKNGSFVAEYSRGYESFRLKTVNLEDSSGNETIMVLRSKEKFSP